MLVPGRGSNPGERETPRSKTLSQKRGCEAQGTARRMEQRAESMKRGADEMTSENREMLQDRKHRASLHLQFPFTVRQKSTQKVFSRRVISFFVEGRVNWEEGKVAEIPFGLATMRKA